jgi:hypothetical protein
MRRSGVPEVMQIVSGGLSAPVSRTLACKPARIINDGNCRPIAPVRNAGLWGAVERQALIGSKPNVLCETVGELRTLILENTKSTGVLRG